MSDLNLQQLEEIRAAVKPGDGWGADDWELRLCEEAIAFARRRAPAASPAPVAASAGLLDEIQCLNRRIAVMQNELNMRHAKDTGDVWYWQGDGSDNPASMCNALTVVINAADLRAALSSAPMAQAEPAQPFRSEFCGADGKLQWRVYDASGKAFCYAATESQARAVLGVLNATPAVPAAPSERDADAQDAARWREMLIQMPGDLADALECSATKTCINEAADQMIEEVEAARAEFLAKHGTDRAAIASAAAPAAPIERENG